MVFLGIQIVDCGDVQPSVESAGDALNSADVQPYVQSAAIVNTVNSGCVPPHVVCDSSGQSFQHVSPSVSDDDDLSTILDLPHLSVHKQVNVISDHATASHISIYTKDLSTRTKNRRLPCFFCGHFVYHMNRHLSRKHSENSAVAAALAKSSGKAQALHQIQNR